MRTKSADDVYRETLIGISFGFAPKILKEKEFGINDLGSIFGNNAAQSLTK